MKMYNPDRILFDEWKNPNNRKKLECLHKKCSMCKGTGHRKNGEICIHYISCRCKLCNPHYKREDL